MKRLIRGVLENRFVRFASIGLLCLLLVQLPIMLGLTAIGINPLAANAAGFLLSAVVNFDAQRRFNFDNDVKGGWLLGMLKFQLTSVGALGINIFIAWIMLYEFPVYFPPVVAFVQPAGFGLIDAWSSLAVIAGALGGTGSNFVATRTFTFGSSALLNTDETAKIDLADNSISVEPEEREIFPDPDRLRWLLVGRTLAVFMPAYNEGVNLPTTVSKLVTYFRSLDLLEFRLFIINDGSKDNTGQVAEGLAELFREVEVIHHEKNQGYGGALITGFNAVVGSGLDLWAFCDSDGQFAPESFGTVLSALFDADGHKVADLTVGYRLGRRNSDSARRFWLGRAWHFFGKFVVGRNAEGNYLLNVHDVDCGIKGGFTKSLALFVERLQGRAAAISPELIARTNMANQVIVERGVTHLSRLAGVSTGDNLRVMIRSALNIVKLGLRFRRERLFGWVNTPLNDAQKSLTKEGWL